LIFVRLVKNSGSATTYSASAFPLSALIAGSKDELIEEEDEMVSQQYPTGIGKIDILVRDKATAQYVVIELKKNQTSDDTIGQLTRYMGWLEEHKTQGKATKGIIIASAYDQKLRYALRKVQDVDVYTYQVDFKLKPFIPV
jgi:restriction system protein